MEDIGQQLRWGSTGAIVMLGAYSLRRAFRDALGERDEALRQTRVLATAASELNATLDPDQVIATAVRLVAEMASPPGVRARRANYCRIQDGTVRIDAEFDAEGDWVGESWPLAEHPHLAEVVSTRAAKSGRLDPAALGPAVRAVNRSQGVGYGGWVPVVAGGELHGVLAVAGRNRPVNDHELSRCVTIAQIMELALSNALTHRDLKRAALTDPLTSLVNRRGLGELVRERGGRRPLTVLAIDIDGLKAVNDRDGHAAGDELLVTVARALAAVMPSGDVVARVGGDEFVCVLFDSDHDAGARVAKRILDSVHFARLDGHAPRASIGVAYAAPGLALRDTIRRADAAMYAAKRAGGMRYRLAGPTAVPDLPERDAAA
ncbi:MAG: diguanylate cyclase [Steroidobacteraceae bacterium]